MNGLLGIRLPILARRIVTLIPALVVLALGAEPSRALVISQVVLSIGIPFALIPLVVLTARRDVMGEYVNLRRTTAAACLVAAIVIALNVSLLWLTFTG
jgi:manganese transport protein